MPFPLVEEVEVSIVDEGSLPFREGNGSGHVGMSLRGIERRGRAEAS
jgi:hypothetical protein